MKKRILAGLLCAVMTASLLATDTISLAAGKTDTVAATSATSPSIDQSEDTSGTSSTASDTSASDSSASDEQSSVISLGTKKVNGVSITIEAPEGVLPDGASFTVKAITGKDQDKIENIVEKELTDDETLESLQSFDITIYDKDGTEIQPDGSVNVIFKNADAADAIADPAREVKIFHMDDSLKSAEEVTKVDTTSDALKIEADHFSVYTIAVTDNEESVDKGASGFITSVSLQKATSKGNDQYDYTDLTESTELKDGDTVALKFDYKIVKADNAKEYKFKISCDKGIPIKNPMKASIINSTSEHQVGEATLKLDTDGKGGIVTVTFNSMAETENVLQQNTSIGTFWIGADLDADKLGNGGPVELKWKLNGTEQSNSTKFKSEIIQPTPSVSVSKVADTKDMTNHVIKWTVTLTPSVTNLDSSIDFNDYVKSLSFTDTISDGECENAYIADTENGYTNFKPTVTIGSGNTAKQLTDVLSYDSSSKQLSFTNGGLSSEQLGDSFKSGNQIVITYYTKYNVEKIGGGKEIKNNASSTLMPYQLVESTETSSVKVGTDEEESKKVTGTNTTIASIAGGSVTKEDAVRVNGTKVKWVIKATNTLGYANPTLTDTIPKGLTFNNTCGVWVGDTKIDKALENAPGASVTQSSYYYKKNDDGTTTIYFYLLSSVTSEQTITYETIVNKDAASEDGSKLQNHVVFTWGTGTPPGTHQIGEKTAYVDVGSLYATKSGSYNAATHQLDWTITMSDLAVKVGDSEITITDKFDTTAAYKQFLVKKTDSDAEVTDWTGAVKLTVGYKDFYLTPTNLAGDTDFHAGFVLKLNSTDTKDAFEVLKGVTGSGDSEKASADVTLSYKTQLDTNLQSTYGNNFKGKTKNTTTIESEDLPSKKITISATPDVVSNMLSKSCNSSGYDYVKHKASWTLIVNTNQMEMTTPVVVDSLDQPYWQYDETSLAVTDVSSKTETTPGAGSDYTVKFTQSADADTTSKMEISLTAGSTTTTNKKYQITYDTYLPDNKLEQLNTNETVTVENTAKINAKEVYSELKATGKITINKGVLSKKYDSTDNDYGANWIITLNENYAAVTNETNTAITISDTIDSALLFPNVSDAIKVVQYPLTGTNNSVDLADKTDYTWTFDEKTGKLAITFLESDKVNDPTRLTDKYVITISTVVSKSGSYSNEVNLEGTDVGQTSKNTAKSKQVRLSGGYTGGFSNLFATIQLTKKNLSGTVLTGATYEVYKADKTTKVGKITTVSDSKQNVLTVSAGSGGAGATYYLKEMTAPSGYQKSEDWIQADVKGGETTEVVALDIAEGVKTATYKISKQSLGQGLELVGATLTISTDDAGKNVITSWTSDGTTHEVTLADGTYYLTEKAVPYGYTKAVQICFTVQKGTDDTGTITSITSGGTLADNVKDNVLIMKDSYDGSNTTKVSISKVAAGQGTELKGAKLTVTAVKNGTTETIDSWTSDGSAREISDIAYQVAYTLTEDQAPTGYDIAESITFKLVKEGDGDVIYILNTSTGVWEKSDKSSVIMEDRRTGTSGGNNGGGSGNSGGSSDDPEDSMATPTPALKPSASPSPAAAAAGDDNGVNGANLPKTGGFIGTVTAYGVGIALILAGCYLFFKKKKVTGHDKRRED